MKLSCSWRALLLVMIWPIMFAGCGSTNRSAPVEDRTRGSIDTPPVESRTNDKRRNEPKPQPVAKQTDSTKPARITATSNSSKETTSAEKSNTRSAATQPAARSAEQISDGGDWRPQFYTVRKGDTLYSIALDFGQDYRDVAAWNNLANASYIQIGQRLRVSAPASSENAAIAGPLALPPATLAGSNEKPDTTRPVPTFEDPVAYRSVYSQQAYSDLQRRLTGEIETTVVDANRAPAQPTTAAAKPKQAAKPAAPANLATPDDRLRWEWPATGGLLYSFNEGPIKKGVAIKGQPGQPVVSSAPGKVVYSGSGLRGYGNLIIVKHNATYLSVYAHNRQVLVSEGQMVAQGQKIGVMGEISPGETALHFEIRRLGKPINPLKFLPDRAS